jgi:hypothetical protein
MNESSPARSVLRLLSWFVIPVLVVMLWLVWIAGTPTDGAFIRFVNAMLTSFTLVSFMLLLTLVVYGDARKRPVSPLLGMLLCVSSGAALTVFFLSQGDLLMEANGSVQAQALSNIIRFATTAVAAVVAVMIVGGTLFSSLLNSPPRTISFEEE